MFGAYSPPPLVEVDGVRVRFSGDRIESESDSVPETACWMVAMPGPKCFYGYPEKRDGRKKRMVMSACAIEIGKRGKDGKRV